MTISKVPRRNEKKLMGETKIGSQRNQVVDNLSYIGVQGPPQSDCTLISGYNWADRHRWANPDLQYLPIVVMKHMYPASP